MATLTSTAAEHFGQEIGSFRRYLRAENKSDNTTRIYTDAAERFANWLASESDDDVVEWGQVRRKHIQEWIIYLGEQGKADGYRNNWFRSIQQFWRWWAEEFEEPNPIAGLKPPHVPENLGALLKDCEGKCFIQRRDKAILYVFMDSGIRRGELVALRVEDLDLDQRETGSSGRGDGCGPSRSAGRAPAS
ncbi:phage integrase N-terminal SAM-like domain-containing protein [Herbidospora sp. NBRC 101105]|uniref:tyrosine-type recombinase/integrase n=1 Tax=Herbidospora sp. NBRC 101105 TaxID=3032195 RepID=UPI0024A29685|nr:phage integrase N-terminal SAM-like domain-containing protein [Herbidospora sp. NBRC 101105]GLX94537.1 hypothetical protein Hesp01_24870 [Herbidospora sp. NBRC 101105]